MGIRWHYSANVRHAIAGDGWWWLARPEYAKYRAHIVFSEISAIGETVILRFSGTSLAYCRACGAGECWRLLAMAN